MPLTAAHPSPTTTTPTVVPPRRLRMIEALYHHGFLFRNSWKMAFRAIPRELFLPEFSVRTPHGLEHYALAADVEGTLRRIYSTHELITQLDDHGTPTSTATAPGILAVMLEQVGAERGDRVLEIGTGCGYTTALLCHAVGDNAVHSVDIHPDLVGTARHALARLDYHPTIVTDDGARGLPELAPYDRLLGTCDVTRIPSAWVQQMTPGGVIVASLAEVLVRLTVTEHGTAAGVLGEHTWCLPLRDDAVDVALTSSDVITLASGDAPRQSAVLPRQLEGSSMTFLRTLIHPEIQFAVGVIGDQRTYFLAEPTTGSWARVIPGVGIGAVAIAEQSGPRRLWDDVVALGGQWEALGHPAPGDYSLTVTPDGTHTLHHHLSGWSQVLHPRQA